ncbi:MAG: fumarylacetoacetate hydrolase family protein [Aquabacterium sp.]|nr:fumarylacetoacetate hydrolase family protein [Aquabacterium sp.]
MLLHSPQALAAAQILADRRLTGTVGPRLPEPLRPQSLAEALAIQSAVSTLMGDTIGGWKCGSPGPGKVVVAPIYASSICRSSPCSAWAHEGRVRVEPELAFVMGCDLPVRDQPYEPADVDAAIAHTHLALELIDSRYADDAELSFADKLADGLVNQGLFLGPEVDGDVARHTSHMPIGIRLEGCEGTGDATLAGQHPDAMPRAPLYWLAEYLRQSGQGLQAGQVVITGSYAGTFGLPVDKLVSMVFGDLGSLTVVLTAHV